MPYPPPITLGVITQSRYHPGPTFALGASNSLAMTALGPQLPPSFRSISQPGGRGCSAARKSPPKVAIWTMPPFRREIRCVWGPGAIRRWVRFDVHRTQTSRWKSSWLLRHRYICARRLSGRFAPPSISRRRALPSPSSRAARSSPRHSSIMTPLEFLEGRQQLTGSHFIVVLLAGLGGGFQGAGPVLDRAVLA